VVARERHCHRNAAQIEQRSYALAPHS